MPLIIGNNLANDCLLGHHHPLAPLHSLHPLHTILSHTTHLYTLLSPLRFSPSHFTPHIHLPLFATLLCPLSLSLSTLHPHPFHLLFSTRCSTIHNASLSLSLQSLLQVTIHARGHDYKYHKGNIYLRHEFISTQKLSFSMTAAEVSSTPSSLSPPWTPPAVAAKASGYYSPGTLP